MTQATLNLAVKYDPTRITATALRSAIVRMVNELVSGGCTVADDELILALTDEGEQTDHTIQLIGTTSPNKIDLDVRDSRQLLGTIRVEYFANQLLVFAYRPDQSEPVAKICLNDTVKGESSA